MDVDVYPSMQSSDLVGRVTIESCSCTCSLTRVAAVPNKQSRVLSKSVFHVAGIGLHVRTPLGLATSAFLLETHRLWYIDSLAESLRY